jgi:ParB-like chromosome segregation protein Spo0J
VKDPINRIEWRDAASLEANGWNPNVVFTPELRKRSILLTGWTQPILITAAGLIIDGFHRVRLAIDSLPIFERYGGKLPCAVVNVSRPEGMILTIRMNRAKGSHVAVRMSEIVRELIDVHGYEPIEVGIEIGATKEEIAILYQEGSK